MGCGGGYRDLFIIVDYMGYSGRGCGTNRRRFYDYNRQGDTDEKLMLVKKFYAEGYIDDTEYLDYKEKIYAHNISFDEWESLGKSRSSMTRKKSVDRRSDRQNPLETLKIRFAKGEISEDEYEKIKSKLIKN